MRTIIDPQAPQPEYVGLLGFGSYAQNSGAHGDQETTYFVFGSSFLGYWEHPDGTVAWFNNPAVEHREQESGNWLERRREASSGFRAVFLLTAERPFFVVGVLSP